MSEQRITGRIVDEARSDNYVFGQAVSPEFRAAFEEEYQLHQPRGGIWWRYLGVALVTAIVTFSITWAIAASRPVSLTLAAPIESATPKVFASASSGTQTNVVASSTNTGQVALTEDQLKAEIKAAGGGIFWAGTETNASYTFNHIKAGQDFVRYLPNGQGLSDTTQNFRVIATYRDSNAFATVVAASKISGGPTLTNPDGSFVYYAKETPLHVYIVFKGLPYQIEIFDPKPGASLKLATTPGFIKTVI